MIRALIIFFLLFSMMIGCAIEKPKDPGVAEADRPASVQAVAMEKAYLVLNALKEKNMEEISGSVHPQKGVLFSPFGIVDKKRSQVLMPAQVKELFQVKNQKQLEWGKEPRKGEPIRLTPEAYFNQYVYDAEYSETELVTYDDTYQNTNDIQNMKDTFPNSHFVEFFVPGSEEFEEMDWKSLKLVFSEHDQELYLVGIVHDQWMP